MAGGCRPAGFPTVSPESASAKPVRRFTVITRRKSMRGLRHGKFVALGAVVALAAAACGGSSGGGGNNAGSVSKGGTFSVYIVEPQYLIPANTNETSGSQVDAGLFTPLVDYDQKTNAPHDTELTDSIKSSDQKVWDIKIKSGWKFHDGTPVTSDSFIDA